MAQIIIDYKEYTHLIEHNEKLDKLKKKIVDSAIERRNGMTGFIEVVVFVDQDDLLTLLNANDKKLDGKSLRIEVAN